MALTYLAEEASKYCTVLFFSVDYVVCKYVLYLNN